jgi:anion-transporting  ArsA/GET3 family ATPase
MNDTIICDTPEKINAFRLLSLKGALSLEVKGLKRSRGPSAFATVKAEFGLKGSKAVVLEQFVKILKEKGILV